MEHNMTYIPKDAIMEERECKRGHYTGYWHHGKWRPLHWYPRLSPLGICSDEVQQHANTRNAMLERSAERYEYMDKRMLKGWYGYYAWFSTRGSAGVTNVTRTPADILAYRIKAAKAADEREAGRKAAAQRYSKRLRRQDEREADARKAAFEALWRIYDAQDVEARQAKEQQEQADRDALYVSTKVASRA
jgi:hypothetical protein